MDWRTGVEFLSGALGVFLSAWNVSEAATASLSLGSLGGGETSSYHSPLSSHLVPG